MFFYNLITTFNGLALGSDDIVLSILEIKKEKIK